MKVYISPTASGKSPSGIANVAYGQTKYLPEYGIEVVTSFRDADVANIHVGLFEHLPPTMPLVVSNHGVHFTDNEDWGKSGPKLNSIVLASMYLADVVTVPSFWIKHAIQRGTLISPQVVHHGVDTDEWTPDTHRENYVLWNKARADAACDPAIVNKLAEMEPNIQFVSTFGEPAPNIKLTSKVSPEEMLRLVRKSSVYLDTARESGGPCFGVLEAMACAVPTLSWDFGGTAEVVIHKETGYLARHNDYQDMLEGLHYCLEHQDRLGANAREYVVENFQWKDVVKGYVDAYRAALEPYPVKASVIVTAYNVEDYLENCIQSVLNQDMKDWELIIVDDKSPDNSGQIADKFAAQDHRIKVIHNKTNMHVSDSRNIGMLNAKGKYLLPLDGDDRIEPYALRLLTNALDNDRSLQIVTGAMSVHYKDGRSVVSGWPENTQLELQIQGHNRIPYCSMFRRRVFETTGGYRRRIRTGVEDADFWTRAFSYGNKAEIVTDKPILMYTMRDDSLSHTKKGGMWLEWFPWRKDLSKLPFGAAVIAQKPDQIAVNSYNKPDISVIVPVGPGHEDYIQTCLDSLVAQTHQNFEIVVVNDTGAALKDTFYVSGFPFITLVDNEENRGVAAARNAGIKLARADRIVFLDVDDIAQPQLLQYLFAAHNVADGWIYSDWYYVNENEGVPVKSTAKDWSVEDLMKKSLGPITGIYWKQDILAVGGFDEDAPGWEDWVLHLSLVELGSCGTRVSAPLITYNMHLGQRREDDFDKREKLIKYVTKRFSKLYTKYRAGETMSRCCGKGAKSTLVPKTSKQAVENTMDAATWWLVEYVGPEKQTVRMRSPSSKKKAFYRRTPGVAMKVLREDVEWFSTLKDFKVVGPYRESTPEISEEVEFSEPLVTEAPKSEEVADKIEVKDDVREDSIDSLDLDETTLAFLKTKYATIQDVIKATDEDLESIKGVGGKRVGKIREALDQWAMTSMNLHFG